MTAEDTKKPLVAFLGPPSSYTHQATKSAFPEQDHVYTPVATIKDVFEAVAAGGRGGEAPEYGVVPFENSTHGVVTPTLGCLADRAGAYARLRVCGEVYIDVHHYLLGYKSKKEKAGVEEEDPSDPSDPSSSSSSSSSPSAATPECDLSHVQRVYSHPQAFGQSQAFLARHLGAAEAVDVSSTSRAAEVASRDRTGATAAVAGAMAAEAFGLDVLARCVEDRDDNKTRFFVLRRGDEEEEEEERGEGGGEADRRSRRGGEDGEEGGRRGHKSLVSFTVPHRAPGALATVLDVFRTYGLNLTSINSMPSLIQPFQYLFFVEFEGSREHDPEGKVKGALEEVDRLAESWRWLGSWESQR